MLLAIDTSTNWISLALYDGVFVRYEITWQSEHHHTTALAPALKRLFDNNAIAPESLSAVAVATGPGSFTSLRIGVAAAKGFALGLKIPIVGVPSLDIIAAAQPLDERPLLAVLHAGRTRLAYVTYLVENDAWRPQHEPAAIGAQDLVKTITTPTLIAGELSEEARSILGRRWKNAIIASPAHCLRRAGFLAELGWDQLERTGGDDPVALEPIYLSVIPAIDL